MIVVAFCTRIETLFVRRRPDLRLVRTPMGYVAAGGLDRALGGERPSLIVSAGFCGGLAPALRPGTLVLAERIRHGEKTETIDPALLAAARRGLDAAGIPVHVGLIQSVDAVAASPREKALLREGGAVAVEMEAGSLAELARERRIGFLSLRAVLDAAEDPLPFTTLRPGVAALLRHPILTLRSARRAFVAARAIGQAVPAIANGIDGGSG